MPDPNPNPGIDPNTPQPDPTQHLVDRQYVSQFATDIAGIQINIAGVPGDPDGNAVTVTMYDANSTVVFSEGATRLGVGLYQITFTSTQTQTPGYYTLSWTFSIGTVPLFQNTYIQVGAGNPDYDVLDAPMKAIIESVWNRFADMSDSPQGGPHLQVYFQTAFSRGRLAQLLNIAVGLINTTMQPFSTYTTGSGNEFPYQLWGALLEQKLYIETIKHLIRSYIEMPVDIGVTIARRTRRDYIDRWSQILDLEQREYKQQIDHFKIINMSLSRPRALVSGGVFGSYGPTRLPGSAAARPQNFGAFYY